MTHIIVEILLLLVPLNVLTDGQNCVYPNLNLSELDGLNIQCIFENDPTYFLQYVPCQTNLQCSIFDLDTYMVLQNSISGNCQAGIAKYDANILPQEMTVNGQEAYRFSYANGQASFACSYPRKLNLTFVCDPNAYPYDENGLKCGDVSSAICEYYLEIPTVYACNNDCIWDVNGHILDLSSINGQILTGISNDNPSQTYQISSCGNLINCENQANSANVMSAIMVNNSQCLHVLSRWDSGTVQPTYIENEKKWQFIYTNGDNCNGYQSIYTVFYKCNPFVSGGKIGLARQTATCQFEIEVESDLACG